MLGLFDQSHTNIRPFSLPYLVFHLKKKEEKETSVVFNLQLKCGCEIYFFLRKKLFKSTWQESPTKKSLGHHGQRGKYRAAGQPAKYPSTPGTLDWMGMWQGLTCFSQWAQRPVSGRWTEREYPGTHLSASLQLQCTLLKLSWRENSQVSYSYYWQHLKTVISHWGGSLKNNVSVWKDRKELKCSGISLTWLV